MKKRRNIKYKIPLVLTIIYWLPSSLVLLCFFNGWDDIFPLWLENILIPGLIIGLGFGFGGRTIAAIIGQVISFFVIFGILSALSDVINRIKEEEKDMHEEKNKRKHNNI